MCRNISTRYNFEPAAADAEIRAASLQFVRKVSGFARPSKVDEVAFERTVERIAEVTRELLESLETSSQPKNREVEAEKAKVRTAQRFST